MVNPRGGAFGQCKNINYEENQTAKCIEYLIHVNFNNYVAIQRLHTFNLVQPNEILRTSFFQVIRGHRDIFL